MSSRPVRSFWVRAITLAVVAALLLCAAAVTHLSAQQSPAPAAPARQVAAPPADILSGRLRLPAPSDLAIRSRSALLPVRFASGSGGRGVFDVEVPVESPGDLVLVPFSPDAARWSVSVASPGDAGAAPVALSALVARGAASQRSGSLTEVDAAVHATRWDLHTEATSGSWRIRIEAPVADGPGGPPSGWLLVGGGGAARLVSHLTSHRLVEGERVGVVAALEDGGMTAAPRISLLAAALEAETPLGSISLPMQDDGAHADGAAADGVFGAWLPALPPGAVTARVVAKGAAADGSAVLRSVQHVFPILPRAATLTGGVVARAEAAGRIALEVGVALPGAGAGAAAGGTAPGLSTRLHVSAEVWGAGAAGEPVPVCWLSTMTSPDAGAGAPALRLVLDARWPARAAASAPFELRGLRLQDPDTHVVLDSLERAPVDVVAVAEGWDIIEPDGADPSAPPTLEMLMGAPSAPTAAAGTTHGAGGSGVVGGVAPAPGVPSAVHRGGALMLVHGYCSSGVWPQAHFSQPKLTFLDPNQNRSHDEFAQLMLAFGAQKLSFGVVAHSQGGAAALHLYTFYESGLDHATGGRLIQSVATPYAGTPLAGNLALIGEVFGAGCGENFDMTESGAALWLSTIPTWAREKVHYWTTSNDGSACNFLTNFFLDNPEDGVVEMAKGQLPGAHAMGHKTGWCHSTGMSDPANYTDAARNAEMDEEAAR